MTEVVASEDLLRKRLGIPEDAERVLVFAESTHWDPNWMFRSGEYFRLNVRHVLDRVLDEVALEPRRVFDLECTFFVRRYVLGSPRAEELVQRVNEGRIRFTSSGVTTADTVIPEAEALLRDFLEGQEWMRSVGIEPEPHIAYFPDSFGHSPALPAVLRSAGFDAACFSRIDGMWFPGGQWQLRSSFPLPGSSAEMLQDLKALDFVWRAPDGSEVLAHWNAFTYGHGDLIASHGLMRFGHLPVVIPDRSDRHVSARVRSYAASLAELSPTPYSLCAVGLDFVPPVRRLVDLLDRFNERHYSETGIWALNAGLDDYFELVASRRDLLARIAFDPNPYWTGFYSARPSLKRSVKQLLDTAVAAESAAVLAGIAGGDGIESDLSRVWRTVAVSNHHDFVTGTSPERVHNSEQAPWIGSALGEAEEALDRARRAAAIPLVPDAARPAGSRAGRGRKSAASPPSVSRSGPATEVVTDLYRLVIEPSGGGCVTRWETAGGESLLASPGLRPACYAENGGLWRMGMEFPGGAFREVDKARPLATIEARCGEDSAEVLVRSLVAGQACTMRIRLRSGDPLVRVQMSMRVPPRRCVVLRLATRFDAASLVMAVPGGLVVRPLAKLYDPTFWPLHSLAWTSEEALSGSSPEWHSPSGGDVERSAGPSPAGFAVASAFPTALSASSDGILEVITGRNAPKELGWGVLPRPALPARGYERNTVVSDLAFWPVVAGTPASGTPASGTLGEGLGAMLASGAGALWPDDDHMAPVRAAMRAQFVLSDPDLALVALKRASRGEGIICRIMAPQLGEATSVELASKALPVSKAFRCDARERDLEELVVRRRRVVEVPLSSSITTLRLLP